MNSNDKAILFTISSPLTEEQEWALLSVPELVLSEADSQVKVFCAAQSEASLVAVAQEFNIQLKRSGELAKRNWIQCCPVERGRVEIGKFKIHLLADEETASSEPSENCIYLRPGAGFGTGTHPATRLALELLQTTTCSPERILDLGCGSGILAFAIGIHSAESVIDAYDIDDASLRNAAINLSLNSHLNISSRVNLRNRLPEVERYDLILANLYLDPLREYAPYLARVSTAQCELVLSGLLNSQWESLKSIYAEDWELLSEQEFSSNEADIWSAGLFRKR